MATSKSSPIMSRRRAAVGSLCALGSLGLATLCGWKGSAHAQDAAAVKTMPPGRCVLTPTETAGPFPLLDALRDPAMLRRDITEGKAGIPLSLVLDLRDLDQGCRPVSGAAVYIWHCDRDGQYSGYSRNTNGRHRGETFLRGVQVSDADGRVAFTTIYPGWYPGRITHIHFQIYLRAGAAGLRGPAAFTSQLAFPQEVTEAVYRDPLYPRGQNSSVRSVAADSVFSDGADHQIVSVRREGANAYRAMLVVGLHA